MSPRWCARSRVRQGFTLVELLVVVLLIGILAAIALPRLLGQRTRAKNAAAQAAVRHALVAAKSYYTQNSESYAGLGPSELRGYESSLSDSEPADTQTPGSSANPQNIWIGNGYDGTNPASGDPNVGKLVTLCSASKGDTVYCARDLDGVTGYSSATTGNIAQTAALPSASGGWISSPQGALQILAEGDSSCALLQGGTVKCWGRNDLGQLGDGSATGHATCTMLDSTTHDCSATPLKVSGLSGVVQIAGRGAHTCALLSSGGVRCWGYNAQGQLGDGSATGHATCTITTTNYDCSPTPLTAISSISGIVQLVSDANANCVLLTTGNVKCWGSNNSGALGDGTTTDRYAPVDVSGVSNAIKVYGSSYANFCALFVGGTVKCWGRNDVGQLGNGTTNYAANTATLFGSITNATQVAMGGGHICVLLTDTTVRCSGENTSGKLGDGTTTNRSTPVAVSGLSGVVQITAGGHHTCALLQGGTAKCWGDNANYEQLGDGTTTNRYTPVSVNGLANAVDIQAADWHTCALISDGTVKCWGKNTYGQLGQGSVYWSRSAPTAVQGL